MHILQSALACRRIAQMAHVKLASHLLRYARENLRDGIFALGLFTEHILRARLLRQTDGSNTGSLLSAIVLFLHHQVEFIETVAPRTVFLLVVAQRLQQADHRHTALMLQMFHRCRLLRTT